jgi:hypothetical protein
MLCTVQVLGFPIPTSNVCTYFKFFANTFSDQAFCFNCWILIDGVGYCIGIPYNLNNFKEGPQLLSIYSGYIQRKQAATRLFGLISSTELLV